MTRCAVCSDLHLPVSSYHRLLPFYLSLQSNEDVSLSNPTVVFCMNESYDNDPDDALWFVSL